MKILIDRLKPYWKLILLILLAHLVQATALLSLPTFTSAMVDTGIQNRGFEYAAPIEITEEDFSILQALMTDEEIEAFFSNYELSSGTYRIRPEIRDNPDSLVSLNEILKYPMAAFTEFTNLDRPERDQALDTLSNSQDPGQARLEVMPVLANYPEDFINDMGIQANIDAFSNAGNDSFDVQKSFLLSNGSKMLLVALVGFLAAASAHFISAHVGTGWGRDIRGETFDKIINFSNNELSQFSTASLITRTTNDVQQVTLILTMFLRAALVTPIIAVGGVLLILASRADMVWILASGVVVLFVIITILFLVIIPAMKKIPVNLDRLNLVARENLTGVQVIRAFGRQKYEEERFDKSNQNMTHTYMFIDRAMSIMSPAIIFIADIMGCLIIWFGGQKMAEGTMQVGDMMALTAYSMRVFFSFMNVSMMATMLPRSLVSLKRIEEVLTTDYSIKNPENPVTIDPDQVKGIVKFDDVSFQFEDAVEPILEDISFTALPGQTTAIIGSTGSGKSTILNLIMRFIDASEGSVSIDGVDIRNISQEKLREIIGYVPQKAVLFSGNIESNIGYGVDNLSEERMVRAAEIAHADGFIEEKANGYKSRISQGGSNISGGQKQRLSMARAIAKDPQIYLFDDSFSALDYKTDRSLRSALKENVADATLIIVAQRISTILDADNIIVLENGRIEAMGRHEELMETSQVYRQIATSQLSEEELKGGKYNG